jgi:hypothetical protein
LPARLPHLSTVTGILANHAPIEDDGTVVVAERSAYWILRKRLSLETKMIYRLAAALFAGSLAVGAAAAQSTTPSAEKPETACTTSSAATTGSASDKKSDSMAMEKSAILPDAGGTNSAAPTVQKDGKSMEVRPDCPPEPKK